jgi:cyanate lyase
MELPEFVKILFEAKEEKGLTFSELGKRINRDELWVAALFYGQASASEAEAKTLLSALDLPTDLGAILTTFPSKGLGSVVPTDPLIYRFYEIMQVYGYPLKSIIHEKFGDGIMSAIDFTMHVDKEQDPKGDRVKITLSGKFLPYKKW